MTTQEVADRYGVSRAAVSRWIKTCGHNIKREMTTYGMMAYNFTEADCKLFENRPSPGRKIGHVPRNKKPVVKKGKPGRPKKSDNV